MTKRQDLLAATLATGTWGGHREIDAAKFANH
jgi:hypothetical protein